MSPRKKIKVAVVIDYTARDYAMARLAAARVAAASAVSAIDEALDLFVEVDEDEKGEERTELITTALESVGCATRALEAAEEIMDQVDPEECEPWDEGDDDEEDEEDDEDEDEDPIPRATARERRRA